MGHREVPLHREVRVRARARARVRVRVRVPLHRQELDPPWRPPRLLLGRLVACSPLRVIGGAWLGVGLG